MLTDREVCTLSHKALRNAWSVPRDTEATKRWLKNKNHMECFALLINASPVLADGKATVQGWTTHGHDDRVKPQLVCRVKTHLARNSLPAILVLASGVEIVDRARD
jgi:hypothetical protein